MTTGSAQAKAAGLTISEMARILHTHRNTIDRWSKNKPILFTALVEGCKTLKAKEEKKAAIV